MSLRYSFFGKMSDSDIILIITKIENAMVIYRK